MNVRRTMLALAVASSLATPFAVRAASFSVDVDVAPPPAVYEQLPQREGYVVTPGYYRFDADTHKHVWVKGGYERERRGEHYVAPEWREENGRYHFTEGHWDRDK
jgi:hypothetical protein